VEFAEGGRIGIVFQSCRHPKAARQYIHRIATLPSRQIVHVAEGAGGTVERSGATDPNPLQFDLGAIHTLTKEHGHLPHGVVETSLHIRSAFVARQNAARVIDHSHGDLGAPDVDPADHVASLVAGIPLIIMRLFKCFIKTNEY
jgi:hypothetical protein